MFRPEPRKRRCKFLQVDGWELILLRQKHYGGQVVDSRKRRRQEKWGQEDSAGEAKRWGQKMRMTPRDGCFMENGKWKMDKGRASGRRALGRNLRKWPEMACQAPSNLSLKTLEYL